MMDKKNNVVFYCKARREKNTVIPKHSHSCYELVYYLKAKGDISISEKAYPFSSYSFSLTAPYSEQIETHYEDNELMYIGFTGEDLPLIEEGVYSDGEDLSVKKAVYDIISECSEQKGLFEEMVSLKLKELCILLQRLKRKSISAAHSLEYAANFIKENYHTKISFKELAHSCGYSSDYFRHKFLKIYGTSPQQFQMEVRLESSKKILARNGGNCTEAAYMCGFSNSAQFSQMFKKYYGISPKKYIKN